MRTRLAVLAVAMFGHALAAHAQDPVRLPGIRVTAEVEPPGANRIAGIVRDTFSIAVEGVEITLPGLQKRVLSDSAGRFLIHGVRAGKHDLRARKIGYAPQIKTVIVDKEGGVVSFELVPRATVLPAAISSAARGGLSGTVGDTSYHAIANASVRILGTPQRGTTDSLGHFFFPLAPGRYVVAIRQDGFREKIVSVTIPADSGRHMTVLIPPHKRAVQERWNVDDFDRRLAVRTANGSSVFTRDDLERYGFEWATDAVDRGLGIAGASTGLAAGCYATLNGGPAGVEIAALTVDEIETIEVYKNAAMAQRVTPRPQKINNIGGTRGVADSRDAVRLPMGSMREAAFYNQGIVPPCPIVFVWTR